VTPWYRRGILTLTITLTLALTRSHAVSAVPARNTPLTGGASYTSVFLAAKMQRALTLALTLTLTQAKLDLYVDERV